MANYLPIYFLIGFVPVGFLIIACYSTAKTLRLSECRLFSCCLTRRNRNATTDARETTTTDDIEMQSISRAPGPYPPSNRDLHRSAAFMKRTERPFEATSTTDQPTPAPDLHTVQHHRAATLASLERPSSSSMVSMTGIPPRPSAPSPPSSTASAGRFYHGHHPGQWWEDVADAGRVDDEDVVPAFRRERAVPGGQSVFRLDSRGDQGREWTDVSLR